MENDRRFESVYSKKVKAGKRRTYFFDVRRTKGDDFYLTLTESTKRFDGDGYERHKIFLYKEDFNRFVTNLEEVVNYIKTELMPDYDYEEFDRRHEEWENRRDDEDHDGGGNDGVEQQVQPPQQEQRPQPEQRPQQERPPRAPRMDDDMSW